MTYTRGDVVRGPDVLGTSPRRPWLCVSDEIHPFSNEEAIYAMVTSVPHQPAIGLEEADFESGGLPRQSFAAPYALTTIKHEDMGPVDGVLTASKTEEICESAGRYLGLGR